MNKADAGDVAEIHCEALAGDFLPSIGKSFLTMLYQCIIDMNAGFGIVYKKYDRIVGAAVATENTRLFFKSIFFRRFWSLMPKMAWSLLKRPTLIKRTLETLFCHKQEEGGTDPEAELLVLVLHSEYRRQGIGTEILSALKEEFSRRGVTSYAVRTYADNNASNSFYLKSGFKHCSSYIMYNRRWNLYKFELN